MNRRAIAFASLSAFAFGIGTPAAGARLERIEPLTRVSVLYLDAGLDLGAFRRFRPASDEAPLRRFGRPALTVVILASGWTGRGSCPEVGAGADRHRDSLKQLERRKRSRPPRSPGSVSRAGQPAADGRRIGDRRGRRRLGLDRSGSSRRGHPARRSRLLLPGHRQQPQPAPRPRRSGRAGDRQPSRRREREPRAGLGVRGRLAVRAGTGARLLLGLFAFGASLVLYPGALRGLGAARTAIR